MPRRAGASRAGRARTHVPTPPSSRREDAAAVVDALRRLFRATQEYSKAVQSRSGLSAPQLRALQIVDAEPGISIGDLSRQMFAHPSTVSGVVDRLENRKAVERSVDQNDRRGVRLTLTARGRTMLRRGPEPVQAGLAGALATMPKARLAALRASLDEVVTKAEAGRAQRPVSAR
jgi:DNA-binding MarR family transcriptional regulator